MKLIITEIASTSASNTMTYYNADTRKDKDEKHVENFLYKLEDAIEDYKIFDINFIDDRVLKIEYLSDDDSSISTVTFLIDKSINPDGLEALKKSIAKFESYRNASQNAIKNSISDVNRARAMIIRFIESGCSLDSDSIEDARDLLSTLITKRKLVLKNINFPFPISKKIEFFCLCPLTGTALVLKIPFYISLLETAAFFPFMFLCFLPFIISFTSIGILLDFKKNWNDKMFDYFIREYEKKHDLFLETQENRKLLPSMDAKDPFIKFVLSDIEYINEGRTEDYCEDLHKLRDLIQKYIEAKKTQLATGQDVDMETFMRELTDIELVMFGKNKKLGLKRRNSEVIQNAFITERLKYIGITETTEAQDRYLKFIFEQVRRIMAYPYEGCELDLTELYRIASDYVKAKNDKEAVLSLYTPGCELLKRETALELHITEKIKSCQSAEALADDMELLEKTIGIAQERLQKSSQTSHLHTLLPKDTDN